MSILPPIESLTSLDFGEPMPTAMAAATAGARVVEAYFQSPSTADIRSKGEQAKSYDLVTNADVESEEAIARIIATAFPNHAILGEEAHSGAADSEHLWVVDPLDGTNNFAHCIPHFGVSIGYVLRGRPQTCVIANPANGDCFVAERDRGAWRWNDGQWIRCRVSSASKLSESLVGVGFYYDRGAMMGATLAALKELFEQNIHGIRRFGTASLDLCMVGCGMLGAFFEYELSPWDFAAGWLFVEEAGGVVTDCRGASLGMERSSLLASNGLLHPATKAIVEKRVP